MDFLIRKFGFHRLEFSLVDLKLFVLILSGLNVLDLLFAKVLNFVRKLLVEEAYDLCFELTIEEGLDLIDQLNLQEVLDFF